MTIKRVITAIVRTMSRTMSGTMLGTMLLGGTAHAVVGSGSGTVGTIRFRDGGTFAGEMFTLTGVRLSNSCFAPPVAGGLTFFRLPDSTRGDHMRALLLLAKDKGLTVSAEVDDVNKDVDGQCFVRGLSIP